ncbi:MAG: hypothetical protein AMS21_02115 [Gemmatimonas sp. SG8_38_2]|nr:MAG: hypothetical protein AMS21_02115 [Gemmatimonas sp. SG8_38_2]
MPRVHHVKKAQKDNSVAKKGESYYWWKFRYGGKQYSKTYPRASQLTQSDKLSRVYSAQESVEDSGQPPTDARAYGTPDELAAALREVYDVWESAIQELNEVADEYEESADNKEEYFPGTGDEIREKADALRSSADEAESRADEISQAADELDGYEDQFKETDTSSGRVEWNDDWYDEAQMLLDNLPSELEVEVY